MTFYNTANKDAVNYWFSEADSSLEASTYTSIIMQYLEENVKDRRSVFLVSDGCAAQNRNAVLSSALLRFAMRKKVRSLLNSNQISRFFFLDILKDLLRKCRFQFSNYYTNINLKFFLIKLRCQLNTSIMRSVTPRWSVILSTL